LPLFYHASDVNMQMRTAHYLGATKKAILALGDYYKNELLSITSLSPGQRPNLAFPHPNKYTSLDDNMPRTFGYLSQLYKDKLVFRGIAGNDILFIKLVRRYSKEAHVKCSSLGFAPALRGFETIPGGWFMVIMDFIDDEYHELEDSRVKGMFEHEVRERLTCFHQEGFVHGDIRTSNIMVKKDGSRGIKLVDLEWAGIIGEVRYPMNVNDVDVRRPDGAYDNELILPQHDMMMVDFMFE